ncbi:claudin-34-like [Grammomys surdaster]|uniref:claudin-34-like n=1 Tax=Grammomys surdaster TaxID=491861 RepID=UPI0010A026E0|nr:claudin-34-like [Grammomys surdaster]
MVLFNKSANHQIRGFALATIAWILCSTSMGLPECRIWYLEEPMVSSPSTAFIGMWRACICHHVDNSSHQRVCHHYTYHDALVPLDIRLAQHLLLVANIIGLVGTVCAVFALQQLYTEKLQKNHDCNPFLLSAVLNAVASTFIFLAVMCNYSSVPRKEGVGFLPALQMPLFPYAQRAGSAMGVASVSAILFLLSAIIFISYSPSMEKEKLPLV